jgi:PAS domain S-box-containing protein
MQFPELAAARLTVGTVTRSSAGFQESQNKLTKHFEADGFDYAAIEVHYQAVPGEEAPAFLPEESTLIESLADILGTYFQKRSVEVALRQSQDRFSRAFHASPVPISIVRMRDGLVVDINNAFLSTLGYERDEVQDRPIDEVGIWWNTDDRERFAGDLESNGRVSQTEFRLRTRAGKPCDVFGSAEAIRLGDDLCVLSIFYDITERKVFEEQLRFQSDILASVGQAMIATDLDGIVRYWGREAETLFGWSGREAVGRPVHIVTGIQPEIVQQSVGRAARGHSWQGDVTIRHRSGEYLELRVHLTPIKTPTGRVSGVIGVSYPRANAAGADPLGDVEARPSRRSR